jgi:hypothetical protein
MREMYRKIDGWDDRLERCPFCGYAAEMWEYEPTPEHYQKVVMCANGGDGQDEPECPMYMPPEGFYRATKVDAAEAWNKRIAA